MLMIAFIIIVSPKLYAQKITDSSFVHHSNLDSSKSDRNDRDLSDVLSKLFSRSKNKITKPTTSKSKKILFTIHIIL